MNKNYIKLIETLDKFTSDCREEELARHYLNLSGSAIVKIVEYYKKLRTKRPATYANDVLSGKMASLFKRAMECEASIVEDIWTIMHMPEELQTLTNAIKTSNKERKLTNKESEQIALKIIRDMSNQYSNETALRKAIKEHAQSVIERKELNQKALAEAVMQDLKTNYLN